MPSETTSPRSTIRSYFSGGFGLPVTFWAFAITIPLAFGYAAPHALETLGIAHPLLYTTLVLLVWNTCAAIALWNAGVKKPRRSFWGVLAFSNTSLSLLYLIAILNGLALNLARS